jgi:hypothetical protein
MILGGLFLAVKAEERLSAFMSFTALVAALLPYGINIITRATLP